MVLCAEQDPLSEQVEAGAAEHLAFEGFDAADVAFDRAAAVGHGESVGNGGLVAVDAAGERAQVGQVVEVDGVDPPGQALAVAAGHHLREWCDVAGGGAQVRTAGFDLAELGCLLVCEVAGVAGDPPGYLPDGGRGRREHGSGKRCAQRLQVAALIVRYRGSPGPGSGGVGASPVPALLQAGA